ncbi:MAG: sporulation protein YqfD [Oscillospiraceae bacterium]|jgi:hypothetical protein|nr:sporulation protein YqfD [Oscillospiraceae bacterium]
MPLRSNFHLTVSGKRPERALNLIAGSRLLKASKVTDTELSLGISASERDERQLRRTLETAGFQTRQTARTGAGALLARLRRRYVLWVMPLALAFFMFYLSMFVWEIDVSGDVSVSHAVILQTLEECGFGIGTFAPEVDASTLGNLALSRLPTLSYLAVNIHGCRAEVIVRDATPAPKMIASFEPPAPVFRQFSASIPLTYNAKRYSGRAYSRNALVFGKFRVNFYFSSGNYPPTCDIIEERVRPELFGYSLPISWVRTTVMPWEPQPQTLSIADAESELRSRLALQGTELDVITEVYASSLDGDLLTVTRSVHGYQREY